MTQPIIQVQDLAKTYRVPERAPGLAASVRQLFKPQHREVEAVTGITFDVQPGEMVGLIGPNGAGKTTTLKMLSGLLYPTGGSASVAGFTPWDRDNAYLRRISMVMGNRSAMNWDIPPMDSFRVLSQIYKVDPTNYQRTLDELIALLDMADLLKKPVRNLSLGERMKCELVAGLLYQPDVLFLDEPTLGLDVAMQRRLRLFLGEYNREYGVTVILTSHYMADVTALCQRVMLIHHGTLIFDGELSTLAERLAPFKLIRLQLANPAASLADFLAGFPDVEEIEAQNGQRTLRVPRPDVPVVTARILEQLPVADLTVEDPPIEAVIDQVYAEGVV
ncbi:ATP-binding cassette domain-containing protein [bacterium]|nr:ATP-binding cassette domain-containing protein [bacterium]